MKPSPSQRWMVPLAWTGWMLVALGLCGCSEPDESITRSTEDGQFSLTLRADKNWVRPGDSLPIQVRVESLTGVLEETISDRIEFVVNNGAVSPTYFTVTFTGRSDTLATEFETVVTDWITYTVSSFSTSEEQGEVHALFLDLQATLKVRIVD